jgi:hypothetical protein
VGVIEHLQGDKTRREGSEEHDEESAYELETSWRERGTRRTMIDLTARVGGRSV